MLNLFKRPDEDEEPPVTFSTMSVRQKIPILIGIGFMGWMILAKAMPDTFAPNGNSDSSSHKNKHHGRLEKQPEEITPPEAKQDDSAGLNTHVDEPLSVVTKEAPAVTPVVEKEPAPVIKTVASTELSEGDKKHIAQLEEQVAKLSGELAEVKTQMKESASGTKKDQLLEEKLQQHEQAMKQQSEALQGMKQEVESLEAMKQQVAVLQANNAEHLSEMTSFSILKETALQGEPFDNEYKQLATMVHAPEKLALLAQLKPFASTGLPTLSTLQSQFEKLLLDALSPAHKSDTLSHNLHTLIRIRKEGEPQGTDDESILARAEAKINRGEIAGGLKELQPLSPPAGDVLLEWSKRAQAYVDGRNALNELQLALMKEPVPAPKSTAPVAAKVEAKPVEPKPAETAPAPDVEDDDASQQDEDMKDLTVDVVHPATPPATDSK